MNKKLLRKQINNAFIKKNELDFLSLIICLKLYLYLKNFTNKIIGVYWPIENEVDILKFIKWHPYKLSLPKIFTCDTLQFHHWYPSQTLEYSSIYPKIKQPKKNDPAAPEIIVLPCLACNLKGYRLGSGSGMFDRYLTQQSSVKKIHTIGLCLSNNITNLLIEEQHDYKLDVIITEKGIFRVN